MPAPSRNDEYLLYQTLLGSFPAGPVSPQEHTAYVERIVAYMTKAAARGQGSAPAGRTSNAAYEEATTRFVQRPARGPGGQSFLEDLRVAAAAVAWIGFLNGLAMAAIKLTSPGVPDIYQGNETWDFSLVDPDNRRPVDYARRARCCASCQGCASRSSARSRTCSQASRTGARRCT